MDKYLKMSSHFVGNVSINTDGQICDDKYFRGCTDIAEDYYEPICHAINSHDELVAMNGELLEALELVINDKAPGYHDCIDDGESECAWCVARKAINKARGE
ncbi:MAG: hypothetical protein ACRCXB_34715 [Aeromonadaceae bacterium]